MDKLKGMLSGDKKAEGSNTGGAAPGGAQKQDYGDKTFDAIGKKFGGENYSSKYNEQITDAGREQFEKATGKKVPEKFSN